MFATFILAVTVHLLHAFPSGRLHGAFSVATVATGYGAVTDGVPTATTASTGDVTDVNAGTGIAVTNATGTVAASAKLRCAGL